MKLLTQQGALKIFEINNNKGKKRVSHSFDYEKENYIEITEEELESSQNYVPFADRTFIDDFAKYNIDKKFNAKLVCIEKDDDIFKELGYIVEEEI